MKEFLLLLMVLTAFGSGFHPFTQDLSANVINIYLPPDLRSGYGDLMSNVKMATLLKEQGPGTTFNLIVPGEDFANKLKKLYPSFSTASARQSMTIDGKTFDVYLQFKGGDGVPPKPDAAMTFSYDTLQPYVEASEKDAETGEALPGPASGLTLERERLARIAADSPLFIFEEYNYSAPVVAGILGVPNATKKIHMAEEINDYASMIGHVHNVSTVSAHIFATGPLSSGLYVSPTSTSPSPLIPLGTFTEELAKFPKFPSTRALELRDQDGVKSGFSYTKTKEGALRYIDFMKEYARLNPAEKMVIYVYKKPNWTWDLGDLPANLQVVSYAGMENSLMNNLIYRSELPIMVTGDGSITEAIQYGKPFLYENLTHKNSFYNSLLESFALTGMMCKDDVKAITDELVLQTSYEDVEAKRAKEDSFENPNNIFSECKKFNSLSAHEKEADVARAAKCEEKKDELEKREAQIKSMAAWFSNADNQDAYRKSLSVFKAKMSLAPKVLKIVQLGIAIDALKREGGKEGEIAEKYRELEALSIADQLADHDQVKKDCSPRPVLVPPVLQGGDVGICPAEEESDPVKRMVRELVDDIIQGAIRNADQAE